MENDTQSKIYNEYISAMKELAEAQAKARELFPSIPLYPVDEPRDLTPSGKRVFQQLIKAYETYGKKYKIWRIYKKVNAL